MLGADRHLYGAGHSAEGKDGGTVLHSGLVVKRSLSVHQHHSHLQQQKGRRYATWGKCRNHVLRHVLRFQILDWLQFRSETSTSSVQWHMKQFSTSCWYSLQRFREQNYHAVQDSGVRGHLTAR